MNDPDVREQVRRRYAAAATAVTTPGRAALTIDADLCCAPSAAGANASCCGAGGKVDADFGSALYGV
jgi:hypothetical protein